MIYINFCFRCLDAALFANSLNAPGSRDAQFEYLRGSGIDKYLYIIYKLSRDIILPL